MPAQMHANMLGKRTDIDTQKVIEYANPLFWPKEKYFNYVQMIWWINWKRIKKVLCYNLLYSSCSSLRVAAGPISNPLPKT